MLGKSRQRTAPVRNKRMCKALPRLASDVFINTGKGDVLALKWAIQSAVPQHGLAPRTSSVIIENTKAGRISCDSAHLSLIGPTAQKKTLGRLTVVCKTDLRETGGAVLASDKI